MQQTLPADLIFADDVSTVQVNILRDLGATIALETFRLVGMDVKTIVQSLGIDRLTIMDQRGGVGKVGWWYVARLNRSTGRRSCILTSCLPLPAHKRGGQKQR